MADNNNNIPSADPFLLHELIEESSHELANRRRVDRRRQRSGHETQDTQLLQVLQQVQNVEQVTPGEHVQNGEDGQGRTRNGPEQVPTVNETDPRDGQVASSFTHTPDRQGSRQEDEEEPLNIPTDADTSAIRLLKELHQTNKLLRFQGDRIQELERKRRHRSPPRRHYRSRSYSSSRSPPRRHHRRSPSSSRSPPRRYRRRRSYSRSPPRKSRKNQRPETAEERSLSPEKDRGGPSKAAPKRQPRDNHAKPDDNQGKPRRNRHYTS